MVFLRSPFARDLPPVLTQGGVELRVPEMADYESWAALRLESRAFLTPWEPSWPQDDLTRTAFRSRVKRYIRDIEGDIAYPFFVFRGRRRSPDRRHHAVEYPPRRRPDGLGRLLDRQFPSLARAI